MAKPIIKVEHLSKAYQIGQIGTGTISRDIERFVITKIFGKEDPFLKIGETNDRSTKGQSDIVWSLKDLNFEINQGDAVGIIGKNGAGKSTLLKLLSRVTSPTTGEIKIKGRISSLLEVGTGFHPELSGRENIFLNGAILGMRKKEITRKLDEIIDFSGVERYIDTPVKRYSSGMYVRLAFAVAAHLESEILIVDEVLAVGDAEFQKKCLGKMGDISKGEGRTVLFVSHDMRAVSTLCNSSMLLNHGEIKKIGKTAEIIEAYVNDASLSNTGLDLKFELVDNTIVFQTYSHQDYAIYDGSFFIKLIDYTGNEIMLHEHKLKKEESIIKKLALDSSSLNSGVYSLQVKVWATLLSGKDIALATPFYPITISNNDERHKRVFAGKIIDIKL
ncbi:ABC transporter ATP-binding protein [Flavobacterium aciduliphilum]|uniref:ABC-type polysaccharide/polyol phosphate transport system ATPase subunit n=1 Tax=Flavobacterium aciduliphilum TaxID=1101402 RepID=A0A328YAT6_9FLAO|nr:ABC transporter ATP-binding protein [Flavobacterium aciduliphilum]RAR69298.1 ABC-type polysaccharide/polyol phosphate transport system ATPase subunit [Flavobacterium aciduliphilum]